MIDFIIVKYIHIIGIFGIVGALMVELFFVKRIMTRKEIDRISKIDGIYGLSSIIVLAAGLTMWFWIGKPAEFYTSNWVFHTKVGLFVCVGLLSIYPTIYFLKQRKGFSEEEILLPGKIINLIRLEVLIVFFIPILAILMVNGIGAVR